jgi:hypothetical protein
MKKTTMLPDPTPESVAFWLSQLDHKKVHDQGWAEVNRRFHSIARAARPFIREQYPDAADQEAVFDGMVLALLTIGHFVDVEELAEHLGTVESGGPDTDRTSFKKKSPRADRQ